MLINRITSVVTAIFVVTYLLVTISLGFAFNLPNQQNRHLMHNNSNNDHLLALTSTGVRQAKHTMIQAMSSNQLTRDRRQAAQPTKFLNVIYKLLDRSARVKTDKAMNDVSKQWPIITQPTTSFNNNSISSHLIKNRQQNNLLSYMNGIYKEKKLTFNEVLKEMPNKLQLNTLNVSLPTSRNSQRQKRDLSRQILKYITKKVQLFTRKKNNMVKVDGNLVNAIPNNKKTQFLLLKANGTAIYSSEDKKFLCFNPSNGTIVAKDCFDWCLCAFIVYENVNNWNEYVSAYNPEWKIGFNPSSGQPISFINIKKQAKRGKPKLFQLSTYDVTEGNNDEMFLSNIYSDVVEKNSCFKENNWETTGELLFRKEIEQDQTLRCNLYHPELSRKSAIESSNSIKDHKRSLTETNSNNHNTKVISEVTNRTVSKPNKSSHSKRTNKKSRKVSETSRRLCSIQYDVLRLKVRHPKAKRRPC